MQHVKKFISDKGPEYGLFLADPDPKKGCWLEMGRSLEYYLLRNGVNTLLKTTIFNRLTFVIPCLLVFSNISSILILLNY